MTGSYTTTILPSIQLPSPRTPMTARIAGAAAAGQISAADQTALTTALGSIGQSLAGAGQPTAPGDMASKIDSLIGDQVNSGALTDAQASELKGFFAQGPQSGPPPADGTTAPGAGEAVGDAGATGTGTAAGVHHAHHGHHAHAATQPLDNPSSDGTDGTDAVDGTTAASATSSAAGDPVQILETFLDNLRQSLSSTGTYGATGTASGSSGGTSSGLVFQGLA